MSESTKKLPSRREFLKRSGYIAAASALAGIAVPHVHAGEENTIRVALIGCGGRGSGAAINALSVPNGPTKLVALADVFADRVKGSYAEFQRERGDKVDVPEDRRFVGFDAYKKAMDCLKPGDVAILATPPAFRWLHFGYAIEKGLNVFMEKPVTVDGPTTKKMLALGAQSVKKNLKVGVGLMIRHCRARQALLERIQNGEIGDILALRAYRLHGPIVGYIGGKPKDTSELLYQVKKFHGFLWASGGAFNDFYIHQIDECCWMKGAWPTEAQANGGRHYRGDCVDQNFDNYSVEYTFDDGTKLYYYGRCIDGCFDTFSSYAHGTKGVGVISMSSHHPGRCRTFKGQQMTKGNQLWAFPKKEQSPYQLEWNDLIAAIREDKPYNEVERGATASLVSSMGRMAAHTGQIVTFEQMLECPHEFAPDLAQLTMDSPAPLLAGPDGKYPIPEPGIKKDREY
ncbi:MAG: Gfo/Idh/MocA family oxidoreductase [Pirellulales bacterium]|nr:Gfo/Idh/MocA family oxidoreductase [Pirellulales bacterium]